MSGSELRIEVLESFAALTCTLSNLCAAIKKEQGLIAWVQDHDKDSLFPLVPGLTVREKAIAVFNQLQYLDHQAPREILVCAGFIGASHETLSLVTIVNECKERFKNSILALKSAKIAKTDPTLTEKLEPLITRTYNSSITLKKMGLSRLHLKQCYRKIPILSNPPEKIRWTWANTRSIKKITVKEAHEMLRKKGKDMGIERQLQKLSYLPENAPLAIVQDLAPHLRANILFHVEKTPQRLMIKGPLPFFFPAETQTPFPDFKAPPAKSGRNENRSIRSDVKLDPHPFLPAIRAHRYIEDLITD